ncbi:MAG: glycosyltransferase family 2 protein [Rhizobiales bacterium]|nr:glycosyltransferase family 2 protein [Hyphomicrobiales bacterium]
MLHGQRIGVVIPALNEEEGIGCVLHDIPQWVDEIVVADNGSTDETITVSEAAGARAVVETERGYGAACQKGLHVLGPIDIVVFLDADYSDNPLEMRLLVEPIALGKADFVIGSRVTGHAESGALLPQQRFGNWLACLLMRRLFKANYTDLGPFRAIRKEALDGLAMQDRAFGWTVEMQIKAARCGLRSFEVPVSYRRRIGISKISGTLRGSILAGTTILKVIGRSVGSMPAIATERERV